MRNVAYVYARAAPAGDTFRPLNQGRRETKLAISECQGCSRELGFVAPLLFLLGTPCGVQKTYLLLRVPERRLNRARTENRIS